MRIRKIKKAIIDVSSHHKDGEKYSGAKRIKAAISEKSISE
jgi:hypothetical protein